MSFFSKKLHIGTLENFFAFSLVFLPLFIFFLKLFNYFFPLVDEKKIIIFYIAAAPIVVNLTFYLFVDKGLSKTLDKALATKSFQFLSILTLISILYYGLGNVFSNIYKYSFHVLPTVIPISNERFIEGGIGGFLFLLIAILICFISKRKNWDRFFISRVFQGGLYAVGGIIILALFEPYIAETMRGAPVSMSYAPYTGPAWAVLMGGTPLIDVFSQYGLNYLLFSLTWLFVPPSLATAGVLVCFVNIFFYLILLAIAVKLTQNKLLSFLVGVGLILFINSYFTYNINISPSVFGFRFLPPVLLVFTLCRLPKDKLFQWDTIGALFLTSLWSIEAMIGGGIIYFTYIVLFNIKNRRPLLEYVYEIAILLLLLFTPHVVLTLGYLGVFNQWPRYDIYLEIISTYRKASFNWYIPLDPFFRPPVLFTFGYALIFSYALRDTLTSTVKNSKTPQIAAFAVFGTLQFMYYIGRSLPPLLIVVSFPLALLALLPLDWAITQLIIKDRKIHHYLTRPILVIAFILFPLMSATFIDKYFVHPSIYSILWGCLNDTSHSNPCPICNPIKAFERIKGQIINDAPNQYPYSQTLALIEKYQKNKKDILIIHDYSPAILLFLQMTNKLGFSSAENESLSPTLLKEFMENLKNRNLFNQGDVFIIKVVRWTELEVMALNEIRQRWKLCPLESVMEGKSRVTAYYLESKSNACRYIYTPPLLSVKAGKILKLPDGSEVTANPALQIWVKQPGQGNYATSWEDYRKQKGLTIQAVAFDSQEQKPEFTIKRGTPPFKFPDGSEIMVKENDEVWVKLPGQSDYSTPWAEYAKQQGLEITPVIIEDEKDPF